MTLSSLTISNTYSNNGGITYLIDNSTMTLSSSVISTSNAVYKGGIGYIIESDSTMSSFTIQISDTDFTT